jgi:hypothetical protein
VIRHGRVHGLVEVERLRGELELLGDGARVVGVAAAVVEALLLLLAGGGGGEVTLGAAVVASARALIVSLTARVLLAAVVQLGCELTAVCVVTIPFFIEKRGREVKI